MLPAAVWDLFPPQESPGEQTFLDRVAKEDGQQIPTLTLCSAT